MFRLFTVALFVLIVIVLHPVKSQHMNATETKSKDLAELSRLNAQFIRNFINEDTTSHGKIIHPDFVCIQGSGVIVGREAYLNDWATGYRTSGYKTFDYSEEFIRVFGDMALIRSKTTYTRDTDGKAAKGYTIYTDTYVRENGKWRCVQAQITPIKLQ
jgi:hypothetical protein